MAQKTDGAGRGGSRADPDLGGTACAPLSWHVPHAPTRANLLAASKMRGQIWGAPPGRGEHEVRGMFGVCSGIVSHSFLTRLVLPGWSWGCSGPSLDGCAGRGKLGCPFSPGMNDTSSPPLPVPPQPPAPASSQLLRAAASHSYPSSFLSRPLGRRPAELGARPVRSGTCSPLRPLREGTPSVTCSPSRCKLWPQGL